MNEYIIVYYTKLAMHNTIAFSFYLFVFKS